MSFLSRGLLAEVKVFLFVSTSKLTDPLSHDGIKILSCIKFIYLGVTASLDELLKQGTRQKADEKKYVINKVL
jgi:hypothetical protein